MGQSVGSRARAMRLAGAAALASLALALGACQSSNSLSKPVDALETGSISKAGSLRDTAAAAKSWEADPGNVKLGLAYAQQLERLGQTQRQLEVLEELTKRNPDNAQLWAHYGKQLVFNGRSAAAVDVLNQAIAKGDKSWKTYSALGSALDEQGKYLEARRQYQLALQQRPGEVKILNNMAMSYALEGNLKKAEEILTAASHQPSAESENRIRQNLALVVGLQGRYEEARDIASRDLSPAMVEANLAYLQKMMSQKNTWKNLKSAG